MTKYVLIEDEHFAYEEIKRIVQKIRPNYQLVGWATSVEQAILLLKQEHIDLMIVDICLSDGLSFEIFEYLPVDTPILFTTAYDEYALRAFKLNSIDYLLKPIDEKELEAALYKFEHCSFLTTKHSRYAQFKESYLNGKQKNRFLVRIGDSFHHVETQDIAFFYSKEKYVYLHLFSNKCYIINYSLEQLNNLLDKEMFFRVSRNCIANIRSIKRISKYFASRLKLSFQPTCPIEVLVSHDRVNDFLKWMDDLE
ncbi:MAG: LytTR family DNA-binding domain-containing protein [Bacteroidales bacterium]|nr:LytTR family DNA-binding domain-containing protein [Bacteroidales bacterium]